MKHLSLADVLVFVPARGGSKGIPRKNLHPFRGRPLLSYTLQALREVPELEHVLVSSDDDEIRIFCEEAGFGNPYRRPDDLATDNSPIIDSVLHGLTWAQEFWCKEFSYVLLVQPTSPLRRSMHIREFLAELDHGRHEALVSVSPMVEHPMECIAVVPEVSGWRYLVEPPHLAHGRQMYRGDYYFINGALYAATPSFLAREQTFLAPQHTGLYVMSSEFSLDIDTPDDLMR